MFKNPARPHRELEIVSEHGMKSQTTHLGTASFKGQPGKIIGENLPEALELSAASAANDRKRCGTLLATDDYIARCGNKLSKARAPKGGSGKVAPGSRPASDDDDGDGSEDGESSDIGSASEAEISGPAASFVTPRKKTLPRVPAFDDGASAAPSMRRANSVASNRSGGASPSSGAPSQGPGQGGRDDDDDDEEEDEQMVVRLPGDALWGAGQRWPTTPVPICALHGFGGFCHAPSFGASGPIG